MLLGDFAIVVVNEAGGFGKLVFEVESVETLGSSTRRKICRNSSSRIGGFGGTDNSPGSLTSTTFVSRNLVQDTPQSSSTVSLLIISTFFDHPLHPITKVSNSPPSPATFPLPHCLFRLSKAILVL
ncbi:hypothetical protein AA313_de0202988 [Arthrobotrys entomopaga]|nr:hypothetical protein AA313_de0202988 [Arthrobotrys entomopaga]